MNRTAAKVAKIIDVDLQLVKKWAFEFREYLSIAANPPKGKTRMFSDSDLLVLCYVSYYWEDEPDIECIKVGLNREENFEKRFVEHLYLHTPLIQEPPDGLDESWRHGILLVGSNRYQFLELARNYRRVAEAMLETAIEKDEVHEWAYPVLFAYRHTLELYLKLIGEIEEKTHSLKKCVELMENRHGGRIPDCIRDWILELESIDPGGTAFRYADEGATLNHHYEQWFDFLHFQFAMKRIFDAIDGWIDRVESQGKPAKRT